MWPVERLVVLVSLWDILYHLPPFSLKSVGEKYETTSLCGHQMTVPDSIATKFTQVTNIFVTVACHSDWIQTVFFPQPSLIKVKTN